MTVALNIPLPLAKWAGEQLECEPEMVLAFSRVECKRSPTYPDGFPAILFERHIFWKNAPKDKRQTWYIQNPRLCNPKGVGPKNYGTYADQRTFFNDASELDAETAMEACSWGAFQELGENYQKFGFHTVGEFVDVMKRGIEGQLLLFIQSIKWRGLQDDMQRRDYKTLARLYNGTGYAMYHYDQQIEDAYDDLKNDKIDWGKITSRSPIKSVSLVSTLITAVKPREEDVALSTEETNSNQGPGTENTSGGNDTPANGPDVTKLEVSNGVIKAEVTDSSASNIVPANQEPVVVEKERPSIFVRAGTAIGGGLASLTAIGLSVQSLFDKVVEGITPARVGIIAMFVAITLAVMWWYDRSAQRANRTTLEKIKAASGQNTYPVTLVASGTAPVPVPVRRFDLNENPPQ